MSTPYERHQEETLAAKAERRERGRLDTIAHLNAQLRHESQARQAESAALSRRILRMPDTGDGPKTVKKQPAPAAILETDGRRERTKKSQAPPRRRTKMGQDADPTRFSALEEKPRRRRPKPDPEPSQRGNPRVRDTEALARAVRRLPDHEKQEIAKLLRGIDGTGLNKDQREILTQDVITGYLLSRRAYT